MPGAILEPDAADAALSLELHPWPPDCALAQSLSSMAHRDLHRRQNDPDWIPRILGILVDGAKQPLAVPQVDSGDGSLCPSRGEEPLAVRQQSLGFVIPNEVRDLQFAARCRSLTSFG